jgi:hypothetical protein
MNSFYLDQCCGPAQLLILMGGLIYDVLLGMPVMLET